VLAYVTHDVSVRRKAGTAAHRQSAAARSDGSPRPTDGFANRHYLASFLPQAIAEAAAGGVMLGVVFLDLDRFKHNQ